MSVKDKTPRQQINHSKARIGALSRRRLANDPDLARARLDLRAAKLEDYVSRVVAEAPPLTAEQLDRVAVLLRPGGGAS